MTDDPAAPTPPAALPDDGTAALSDDDIVWYRENHTEERGQMVDGSGEYSACSYCEDDDWPCSIITMVNEIVALRSALDAERAARDTAEQERDAARARVEALTAALLHVKRFHLRHPAGDCDLACSTLGAGVRTYVDVALAASPTPGPAAPIVSPRYDHETIGSFSIVLDDADGTVADG